MRTQGDGLFIIPRTSINRRTSHDVNSKRADDQINQFGDRRLLAAGILDPTFGDDGLVSTDFGSTFEGAFAVALQKDGKAVAVGHSTGTYGAAVFAVARYNVDATLDTGFGVGGRGTTNFSTDNFDVWSNIANSVAIQADGKIVVAGESEDECPRFALARYNSDGSLDNTFGTDGKVTTDFGGSESASGVVVQPDGRVDSLRA